MTEHHPTYWEARNVYQRLADILPLVDKLCFVAEHGEVVNMGRVVQDACEEMFRLKQIVERPDVKALLAGTHVVVPKEPTVEMLQKGREAYRRGGAPGVSGMTIDAQVRAELSREGVCYAAMIEAAQEQA